MTQFLIKQQASSAKGVSTILDAHQQPVYLLVGKRGLRHDVFSLYTLSGDLLGEIKQISLGISPRFELYQNGRHLAELKKIWGIWHEFTFVSHLNWLVMGDLLKNRYRIIYRTQTIMRVTPVLLKSGTAFQLEITDAADNIPCILIAATLNRWSYLPNALLKHVNITPRPEV